MYAIYESFTTDLYPQMRNLVSEGLSELLEAAQSLYVRTCL